MGAPAIYGTREGGMEPRAMRLTSSVRAPRKPSFGCSVASTASSSWRCVAESPVPSAAKHFRKRLLVAATLAGVIGSRTMGGKVVLIWWVASSVSGHCGCFARRALRTAAVAG